MAELPLSASKKVWTTLITNNDYLPGLLLLNYSLKRVSSRYPLVALYTDTFPEDGHAALDARGIPKQRVKYLLPTTKKDYANDPRFYDCWSKLTPFSLTQFDRVVQLDSDMLVVQNMDELMDLHLDPPSLRGTGSRVFAASHACVCNPLKKPHYPKNWTPENCAYTTQHDDPKIARIQGPPPLAGLGMPNGGLQVVDPSTDIYNMIVAKLDSSATADYEFADQSLLSDVFSGRWVPLSYIYNALKSLRWSNTHSVIWQDDQVKNIHYILAPKPWDSADLDNKDELHQRWRSMNEERKRDEATKDVHDRF